jgi:transcription initiation factor TFIIB
MVISEKSDDIANPEWRAFTPEEKISKSRTGVPTSLAKHDRGLATIISKTGRDASGQKLDTAMDSTFNRLRTWDSRTQHSGGNNRNLSRAFSELDVLKDKLVLSDAIMEKAAYIYRKAEERRLIRGRTISGVIAAAVYIACREMEITRTLKDIAAATTIKRKSITRSYRLLVLELGIRTPQADHMKCITKIANKAGLSEKITRQAMNIMREVSKKGISAGKHPMSLAATVLYLSSIKAGENVTQVYIANAAGITEVTMRNRIKEFNRYLHY